MAIPVQALGNSNGQMRVGDPLRRNTTTQGKGTQAGSPATEQSAEALHGTKADYQKTLLSAAHEAGRGMQSASAGAQGALEELQTALHPDEQGREGENPEDPNDPIQAIAALLQNKTAFKANLAVLRVADRALGTLLDIQA